MSTLSPEELPVANELGHALSLVRTILNDVCAFLHRLIEEFTDTGYALMRVGPQVHPFIVLLLFAGSASAADLPNAALVPAVAHESSNLGLLADDRLGEAVPIHAIAHSQVRSFPFQAAPNGRAGESVTFRSGVRGVRRGRMSGMNSLPAGRRYYNGRYFGNFNNRYYGPQYGYF